MTNLLATNDPEVWSAVANEIERQHRGLEMIASENYTSPAVMQAVGSVLTNKSRRSRPSPDRDASPAHFRASSR